MKNSSKFLAAALLGVAASLALRAQSIDSFDPSGNISPSVESFEMTKYGMISPSMYTGAMSFSVPLYTYKDPDFTIPISLDYNFDGYRPGMHSGTVGYGWTLNCGGVITREIRGYPDEGPVYQNTAVLGWAQAKAQGIHYNDTGIRSSSYALDTGPYGRDALIDRTFVYDPLAEIPVFVTALGVKCDPAPDLFHFNFCGYSGDFMIKEDGSIRAYNTNVPFGELDITFTPGAGSPNFAEIVIRTGDGTKYYFGGSINRVETFHSLNTSSGQQYPKPGSAGLGFYDNSVSTQVTAFRLYKIESPAPSSRRVEFNYSSQRQKQRTVTDSYRTVKSYGYTYQNGHQGETGGGGMPDQDASYIGVSYCSPLSSFMIDDGTVFLFYYQDKVSDEEDSSCYQLSGINNYVLNPLAESISSSSKRLSNIVARNSSSQAFFSCSLSHIYAGSGTPKMFLSTIGGLKTGKYTFSYNTDGFYLPKNDTKNTDHWGYWNGKNVSGIRSILKMNNGYPVSDLYDQINGSWKEADCTYSKCGALTAITYPTGGTTTIEYEGNTVSKRITNYSGTFAVACTPYEVGGVRVKKLIHSAGENSGMEDSITYIYSETKTGQTSGILSQMPRYAAAFTFSYYTGSASDETFSCDETAICYSSSNGFPSRDGHIGYGSVIEVYEDSSWQKHTFSSAALTIFCDDKNYDEEYINKKVFGPYDFMTASVSTPLRHPVTVDRKNMRGQVLRSDLYDARDSLRKTIALAYEEDIVTLDSIYFNNGSHFGRMHWSARSPKLSSRTETDYEEGGSKTVATTYLHNSYGQIEKESVNGGTAAGVVNTYYRYGWADYAATPIPAAKTDVVKTRTIGNAERIVSKERYLYSITNIRPASYTQYHITVPLVYYPWMLSAVSFGDGNARTTTFTYNNQNRLTDVVLPGGYSLHYDWDGVHLSTKTEQGDKVTGYLWRKHVGLTKVTEPSGQFATYDYDTKNRLQNIRDVNNCLRTRYSYYFNSDTGTSPASGLSGTNHIATDTYTDNGGSTAYRDVTYYNGLGYEEQVVATDWAATGKNLVTPIVYDNMRRQDARRYLPYPVVSNTAYREASAVNNQKTYYQAAFSDTLAYSATVFETSPEGRPLQTIKEGTAWTGHPATIVYRLNTVTDSLLSFTFTHHASNPMVARGSSADAATLLCTSRTDEDGREVRSFTDTFGRLFCSRVVNSDGSNHNADTYYVYDLRDSLVCVIPPEGIKALKEQSLQSFSFNDSFAADHCFLWWRDGFGRPVGTSAPGGGRRSVTYNTKGLVISDWSKAMENNGFQRSLTYNSYNQITYEEYEDFYGGNGHGGERSYSYYKYSGSNTDYGTSFAFVEDEAALSSDLETTKVKGYLKHEILHLVPGLDGSNGGSFVRGKEYYYDKYGRVIQIVEVDSDGWKARYSTRYDFLGNIIKTQETHTTPGGISTSLVVTYTRDKRGRVKTYARTINGTSLTTFTYTYDNLGLLSSRTSPTRSNEFFNYDIHGWLTGYRAVNYCGYTLFSENLFYNSPEKTGAQPLWSGLISESKSVHYGGTNQTYDYFYDNALRLLNAEHYDGNSLSLTKTEKDISYDLNGNQGTIKRYGTSLEDDLTLNYSANRLSSVFDAVENASYTYSYDANGNLIVDSRKNLQFSYNVLNLPMRVMRGDTVKVSYEYLADGTKVSALAGSGAGYRYRGSFVYAVDALGNETLESVACDEGRITVTYDNMGTPSYRDDWHVKDHLGSVRVVMDITSPAQSPATTTLERSDYLPFGTRVALSSTSSNRWRFGGKEEQDIGGEALSLLDFGARYYDPWLVRWTSQDPMAGKYTSTSPYVYCAGDPVNMVDPEGRDNYVFDQNGDYLWKDKAEGEHRIAYRTYTTNSDGSTTISIRFYDFADPVHDPEDIDNGQINHLEFLSERDIRTLLRTQNADRGSIGGFFINSLGGKDYDYSFSILQKKYEGKLVDQLVVSNKLFIPIGTNYAHNIMNLGNFLWAATGYMKGWNENSLKRGADMNSRFNPRRNGYAPQPDSEDDQLSISEGVKYAKNHYFRAGL